MKITAITTICLGLLLGAGCVSTKQYRRDMKALHQAANVQLELDDVFQKRMNKLDDWANAFANEEKNCDDYVNDRFSNVSRRLYDLEGKVFPKKKVKFGTATIQPKGK